MTEVVNLSRCAACGCQLASFYVPGGEPATDDGARWSEYRDGYICRDCRQASTRPWRVTIDQVAPDNEDGHLLFTYAISPDATDEEVLGLWRHICAEIRSDGEPPS